MSNYQNLLVAAENRQNAQRISGRQNISSSRMTGREDFILHEALNRLHSEEFLTLISQLYIGRGDNRCHVCARTDAQDFINSKRKAELIEYMMGQLDLYDHLKNGEAQMRSRSCVHGCPVCEPQGTRYGR